MITKLDIKSILKIYLLHYLLRHIFTVILIYLASDSFNKYGIFLMVLFVIYIELQTIKNKLLDKATDGLRDCIATIIEVLDNHKEGVELLMKVELLKKNPFLAEYIKKPDIDDPNTQ